MTTGQTALDCLFICIDVHTQGPRLAVLRTERPNGCLLQRIHYLSCVYGVRKWKWVDRTNSTAGLSAGQIYLCINRTAFVLGSQPNLDRFYGVHHRSMTAVVAHFSSVDVIDAHNPFVRSSFLARRKIGRWLRQWRCDIRWPKSTLGADMGTHNAEMEKTSRVM